jgi:exopolysaccharide biosynthesis polyprenyl glycosylphosphotransferase
MVDATAANHQVAASPAVAGRPRLSPLVRAASVLCLIVGDVVAITLAFLLAYQIRAATEQRPSHVPPLSDYWPQLALSVASLLLTFALMRMYLLRRGKSHVDQLASVLPAVTIGYVVALAISAFSLGDVDIPRIMLVAAWALTIPLVWLMRVLIDHTLRAARRAGLDRQRLLIVGGGDEGQTILHKVRSNTDLGYEVAGFVTRKGAARSVPAVGSIDDLDDVIPRYGVREVVVADPELTHVQILDIVAACDRARVGVTIFPDVFHLVVREVGVSEFGGLPMLRVRDVEIRGWNLAIKRALDITIAAVLLVLLAPVLVLVAAAVKMTSRGPAFYIQDRVGIDGRPFPCVKFRSMFTDAEARTGPVWASPQDARVTPLGRILRRYSIDELPQLVNVLMGDMSLVGPRPERPLFVEQFSRLIPRYDRRHQEKAGVTGWAQVNGLRGQSPIQERTLYDLFYVEHWSPAFDLKILLKTIAAVLRGRNAY